MAATDENTVGMIEKKGDYYFLNNGTTVTQMDKDAYLRFLENNCPEAWSSYRKGTQLWKAGWGLLGAGLGVEFLIGVPMTCMGIYGFNTDKDNTQSVLLTYGGAMLIGLGSAMEVGSIPLLVVGGLKRNNAYEVYNETCQPRNTVSLNLQASANGIGLALKF